MKEMALQKCFSRRAALLRCGHYSGITKCGGVASGPARVLGFGDSDRPDGGGAVRQCFWLKICLRWERRDKAFCGGGAARRARMRRKKGADEMSDRERTNERTRPTPTDPITDNAPLEVGIECQIHCTAGGRPRPAGCVAPTPLGSVSRMGRDGSKA